MPQGLQVWDASGTLLVDTSTFVYKEIYSAVVTSDGSYTLPAALAGRTLVATTDQNPANAAIDLIVDQAADRVVWKFQGGGGSGNARVRVAIV